MTNEKGILLERVNGALYLQITDTMLEKFGTFSEDGSACTLSLSGLSLLEKQNIDGVETDVKYTLSGTVAKRLPKPKKERKASATTELKSRMDTLERLFCGMAERQEQIMNRLETLAIPAPVEEVKQIGTL